VRRSLLFLVVTTAVGCGAVFDLSALGPGSESDAGTPPPPPDASSDASDASIEEDSSAPCVAAKMRRIGVYCIDLVEVTNGDYEAFLDAGRAQARDACAGDADPTPAENWPPDAFLRTIPVSGVSFCDADAFCRAMGKRLCGRRGGGSLTPWPGTVTPASAETNEWYRACSKAGTKRLPYGDQQAGGQCATEDSIRAASPGTCEGGYLGILDMVGNVEEWIDGCWSEDPDANCIAAGGSALNHQADCTTAHAYARTGKRPLAGIRCCAD
jgi:formylglycine-generating enzyme required for sulfatase activity